MNSAETIWILRCDLCGHYKPAWRWLARLWTPTIASRRLRWCPNCKFLRRMRYERTFYDTVERERARNEAIKTGEYDLNRASAVSLDKPFDPLDPRDAKQYGVKDFNEFDSAMPGLIALSGLDGLEKRHAQTTLVSPDVIRDATHDDHDIHIEPDDDVQHLAAPALPDEQVVTTISAEELVSAPESQADTVEDVPAAPSEATTPAMQDVQSEAVQHEESEVSASHEAHAGSNGVVHLNGHSSVDRVQAHAAETSDRNITPEPVPAYDDSFYDGPPFVIGLSGGIASGKTTVARALSDLGFHVIDVDAQAKSALQQPDVREKLVSLWGRSILTADGVIDRVQVASIVLKDPAKRRVLEEVVRPYVRIDRARALQQASAAGKSGVVLDAPQLFETGQNSECDLVIFVEAPLAQRASRAVERGWTMEHHERRESAQLSIDEKRNRSHAIIVNDSTPEALVADVKAVVRQVRALAEG
ncbi:MAG: dephospho-CoA kinase [Phycisphaerales bacterium]